MGVSPWRFKSSLADHFLYQQSLKKDVDMEEKIKSQQLKKPTDVETQKIQKRLELAENLFNFAYSVKFHQLQKKHSDWSNKQIHEHTMLLIERGCA